LYDANSSGHPRAPSAGAPASKSRRNVSSSSSSLSSVRLSASFSSYFSSSLLKYLSSPKPELTLTTLPSEEDCRRGRRASVTCFVP